MIKMSLYTCRAISSITNLWTVYKLVHIMPLVYSRFHFQVNFANLKSRVQFLIRRDNMDG